MAAAQENRSEQLEANRERRVRVWIRIRVNQWCRKIRTFSLDNKSGNKGLLTTCENDMSLDINVEMKRRIRSDAKRRI